jgi:3-dehydroquinate synthase
MNPTYPIPPRLDQQIVVRFAYPVCFTDDLFAAENPLLADTIISREGPARVMLVLDDGVAAKHPQLAGRFDEYCRAHGAILQNSGDAIMLPGGEAVKAEPRHLDALYEAIYRRGLDRHAYVIAVGGGAVLDLVGYAAATAHRGLRLIRVPTTVLAQNDSGVGVKNSVNAWGRKNFLGTFAPPDAVLNDFQFLTTLDDRDWRAGISEAVKVALIKDAAFFDWIERSAAVLAGRDLGAMRQLVFRCAQLHLEHIARGGDPFEHGSARPLDFGHWSAHKLEQVTHYELRHGEAVAIGIALDTVYSHRAGLLPEHDARRVLKVLADVGLPTTHPAMIAHLDEPSHEASLLRGLEEFREHIGGELTITLLRRVGEGVEVHAIDDAKMRESVRQLAGDRR